MRLFIFSLGAVAFFQPISVEGNFITSWLKQVGIEYVPPAPRPGTCRDCSRSEGRFGFDITPTQATGPCCAAPLPTPTCKCGVEGAKRVVGGTQTYAGQYPWIVSLNFGANTGLNPGGCAGTLVAAQWVVTGAQCIQQGCQGGCNPSTLSVVLGEYDLSSSSDSFDSSSTLGRKNMKLEKVIMHESYDSPLSNSNDIALLKLVESVDINRYVPACLPAADTDYAGQTGTTYGWGYTATCPKVESSIMNEVEVPIVSDTVCEAASGPAPDANTCVTAQQTYNGKISPDMLCAGTSGKDACIGDSGAPLTVKSSTSQHDLAGIVSWGAGCGSPGFYGVYADVPKLRTWIDTTIASNGAATFCPV